MSNTNTPIKAVILDAFDTLILRSAHTLENPYEQILQDLNIGNPELKLTDDRYMLLTQKVTFADYIDRQACKIETENNNVVIGAQRREEILRNAVATFEEEQKGFFLNPDWQSFHQQAQERGLVLGIGSNLSLPYAAVADAYLGDVNYRGYSCHMGVTKPKADFYKNVCDMMSVDPDETIVIGNSFSSDVRGAHYAGIAHVFWLATQDDFSKNGHRIKDDYRRTTPIRSLDEVLAQLDVLQPA